MDYQPAVRCTECAYLLYVLSIVAFVLWSMATIDTVAQELGLGGSTEEGQRAYMLLLAALIVPAVDSALSASPVNAALTKVLTRRRAGTDTGPLP
jgi:hypothetical protein